MAGFGGAVKLTGESEYRKALQAITQELKEVDSELKLVASQYDKNDSSQEALEASAEALSKKLSTQAEKVKVLKDNYKSLQEQAEKNKKKHDELKTALDNESQKLADIEKTSGKTSDEYKAQAKIVSDLASEYKKSTTNINNQESALSKARIEINNAETAYNNTSKTLDKLEGELNDTEKESKELGTAVKNAGDEAEKSANGGFTVLKGVLSNLASSVIQSVVGGLKDLAGEAIDAADSLTKFETTMSFAGYDASTIEKAKNDVKDYADKTVYELNDIANTTAQLAANGIDDFSGLTQAAGNLNAVAGGNKDTFKSVAMVLTQTAGAGKLTTENWNQLANAIPGASGKIQEALKKNKAYTGDFREAMAKGEITADEFNQALLELGSDPVAVEAATSVSTFEGAVGNMKASVVSGFLDIYDTIGQENVTGFINEITRFINDIIPPLKSAVSWFISNLPVIAPILGAIAGAMVALFVAQKIQALVVAFQAWRVATEGQTVAQALLNTVMNANPIMLVVTLIGALVGALIVLWNTNDDFREALTEAWENIKEVASDVWEGIGKFFAETLPNALSDAVTAVGNWFNSVVDWVSKLPGKLWEFFTDIINKVGSWAISIATKAKDAAKEFFENVVNGIKELPSKVGGFISDILSKVISWAADMSAKAKSAARDFFDNVVNGIKNLPDRVKEFLRSIITKVAAWASEIIAKVKSTFTDLKNKAKEGAKNIFDNVVNGIKELPDKIKSIGGDLVRGLWNGINDMKDWVLGKVKSFGSSILSGIKGVFGIHSPSTVFRDQVGKNLALGLGDGFTEEMKDVSKEMQGAIPTDFDIGANLDTGYVGDLDSPGYLRGGLDFYSLVNAFKEALGDMTVELDDQQVGRFVRKTVTDAIYN